MRTILETIRELAPGYGSIPFWSWNDKLEEGELRRQIRRMKELEMNGFFMHARGGLETAYLSDEWFACVNACVDEAKRLGMEAWSYDENGWPSGFAGGKLLNDKKNFALGLLCETVDTFPTDEDTVAVYTGNETDGFTWVTAPVDGVSAYLRIYRQYDESYVDVLDGEITKEFLRLTHEAYKTACGDDFGTAMPGFFTDEPQYFRWGHTYSNTLPAKFKETYGYEIFPGLPAIFFRDVPGGDKFRFDYYKLLHEQFIENWIKLVYEWCQANGVKLTGHAVEESSLEGQMMCIGGVMPFYAYEDIPGIDYLGRDIAEDISPKQLGSACAQLGKKKALSEMFACCGWDVSPTELKRIADLQYAGGVNLMCQHLYPYSERGQRKRDYPLHYSDHNPWQASMAAFDRYYSRLGATLAQGEEYAPILVIHPIHGVYMRYKKDDNWHAEMEEHFVALSRLLGHSQIPYHYGDENMMKTEASVQGDTIRVGKCVYDTVVVPFTYSLDHETAELLRTYMANGGKVWLYKDVPGCIDGAKAELSWLASNITFDDLLAKRDVMLYDTEKKAVPSLRKMTRNLPDGSSLIYLTNITADDLGCITAELPAGRTICEIDLFTLETKPVHGRFCKTCGNMKVLLRFDDAQSHLLLVNGEGYPFLEGKPPFAETTIPVPKTVSFAEKPENMMTLDMASLSKDGIHYDAPLSIYGIKDNLLREQYNNRVWIKYTFTAGADYKTGDLRLVLEPMGYDCVTVNGTEVHPDRDHWWFDRSFASVNIAHAVKPGVNEVIVSLNHYQRDYVYYVLYGGVSESLRNCLVFDTEIEAAYLVGDFALDTPAPFVDDVRNSRLYDGTFTLVGQKDTVSLADVVKDGYPFFGGHLRVRFSYDYSAGEPTVLALTGRFATCRVKVNGVDAGEMLFTRRIDLAALLREGANDIELELTCAMRNLMGPHHRKNPEPMGVGPTTFSFEKEWNGRACPGYVDRYAFVRFGAEGCGSVGSGTKPTNPKEGSI